MDLPKNSDKLLKIAIFVIMAILVLRDLVGINIPSAPFAAIIIYFALFLQGNNFVSYLYFIFPLIIGIPGSYVMPVFALLCFYRIRNIKINTFVFILIFSFWEMFHFAFYTFTCDILLIIRYLSYFIIFILLLNDFSLKSEFHRMRALYFVIGCVVAMICIMLNTFIKGSQMTVDNAVRLGGYITENLDDNSIRLAMNPNDLAYFSILSISILLVLLQEKQAQSKKIYIFSLLILFIAGFLSLSRTWILVTSIILFIYFNSKTSNRKFKNALILIVLIAIIYLFAEGGKYFELYINRFTDNTVKTGGARTDIFSEYNGFLLDNPFRFLLGTGSVYYKDVCQLSDASHNSLQQIYVSYGIIGFIAFIIGYMRIICKFRNITFIYWLPVIACLLFMQSIQFLNPFFLMFPVAASLELLKAKRAKE